MEFVLIKEADERLGDAETVTLPDGEEAVYSPRARILLDAVYDWSQFDGKRRFGLRDSHGRGYAAVATEQEGLAAEGNAGRAAHWRRPAWCGQAITQLPFS